MKSFRHMDLLNKHLRVVTVHRLHDGFVFIAGGEKFQQAMGDIVGKVADKNLVFDNLDFMFCRSELYRFSNIQ